MPRPSRLAITLPPRDPQSVRALYQTGIYNSALGSQEAHKSRERARREVARTAEPRSAIARSVVHDLHDHRQSITTRRVETLATFDVVEAPRRLTLTFGGSTQERRGREHKVVERGGYGRYGVA